MMAESSFAKRQHDSSPIVVEYLVRLLELPVRTRLPEGGDPEFDAEFVVTTDHDGEPRHFGSGETAGREEIYRP